MHIADLLVRTAVEIEALSKYLYELDGGSMNLIDSHGNPRQVYFDSDCIQRLDIKWHITKKVVNVVGQNFYFTENENRILRPLKDCNKQKHGGWKNAYQAVKHDRFKDLNKGNIKNLIRAMAALYLLNVYNLDVGMHDDNGVSCDARLDSEVFSVQVYDATVLIMDTCMDDSSIDDSLNVQNGITLESAALIRRITTASFEQAYRAAVEDINTTEKNAEMSTPLQDFLKRHPEYVGKMLNEQCIACGEEIEKRRRGIEGDELSEDDEPAVKEAGRNFLMSIVNLSHTMAVGLRKNELILNKTEPIYPVLQS